MKVSDEVWVATALLHREHPEKEDFSVGEIVERALREKLGGGFRPGLPVHASKHCVATKSPNPGRYRMLFETSRGRRRLFRLGDPFHPDREGGRITPGANDLPHSYRQLLDWYSEEYSRGGGHAGPPPRPKGTPASVLLKFAGAIPPDDLRLMEKVIEEDCERIDPDEW